MRSPSTRARRAPAVDPWEVLRALRARDLVVAFDDPDEEINGGDAVDELAAIRAVLDEALSSAPPTGGKASRAHRLPP